MHSGGTGSRAANRKNKGVDASSRRKKSKNSALKKQLVYYCQVGSWASTDSTPPAHRPAPHPTPTLPVHRRAAPGPAPAVLPGPPQAGPLCLRGPRLHRDKAALTRLPCHCCAEWGGALAGPARRPSTQAPSDGGEALVRLRASVTVGLVFI